MLARCMLAATALVLLAGSARAHDWNERAIGWEGLDDALATAKKTRKPVCLIVYTEWCPHCANYSKLFQDPKVVETAKRFVMVRLDQDKDKEQAAKYAPDGGYIPRTMFLGSDGTILADVHAPNPQYKYFFDEKDPAAVLTAMDAALAKSAPEKKTAPEKKGAPKKK